MMNIDVRTLALIAAIVSIVQLSAVLVQYLTDKTYRGIGWWVLGFASLAAGFLLILLRDVITARLFSIIFANLFLLLGAIFHYHGVVRFLDQKENRAAVISILVIFIVVFSYFTYWNDDIAMRTAVLSAALAFFLFLTALSLFRNRIKAVAVSSHFAAGVFLAQCVFFAYRTYATIFFEPIDHIFSPTAIQIAAFLIPLILSLLLAFALVIMINQRLNAAVKEAKEDFELIFNAGPSASLITRMDDGMIVDVNSGFVALTGYARDEAIGKSTFDLGIWKNPDDRKRFLEKIADKGVCEDLETVFQRKDGSRIVGIISAKVIMLQGKPHIINVINDITERKHIEEELKESERQYRELSMLDELTQLYNVRYFHVQLKNETERSNRYGEPLTLLLLDLDDFKAFNDTYGHVEGDKVLSKLGQVIKKCLRQTDSAYRYGGEEFTVLLPQTAGGEGINVAERIRAEFQKEVFSPFPGRNVHMTASIGIAQYRDREDTENFVNRADQRMYQCKEGGKNKVCWES